MNFHRNPYFYYYISITVDSVWKYVKENTYWGQECVISLEILNEIANGC